MNSSDDSFAEQLLERLPQMATVEMCCATYRLAETFAPAGQRARVQSQAKANLTPLLVERLATERSPGQCDYLLAHLPREFLTERECVMRRRRELTRAA